MSTLKTVWIVFLLIVVATMYSKTVDDRREIKRLENRLANTQNACTELFIQIDLRDEQIRRSGK